MAFLSGGQTSSSSSQSVWKPQRKYLKDVFAGGQEMYRTGNDGSVDQYQQYLDMLNPMGNPYMMNMQNFMQPNNEMVQSNIDLLGRDLTNQFNNNLMPAIASNHVAGGSLGGGRQGVAEGMAINGIQDAFATGSASIMNNSYNQAQNATTAGAELFNNFLRTGFQGVEGLDQLRWNPIMNYAKVIGNPTVLSKMSTNSWNASLGMGK